MLSSLNGCWFYKAGITENGRSEVYEILDGAWYNRLSVDELTASVEFARASNEFQSGESDVLWLLSRNVNSIAYGHSPDNSEELYDFAFEVGFRCLANNTGWLGRLERSGGSVTVAGVGRLTLSDAPCLEQLIISWVRLIEHRGVHSYIDIPELIYLVDRLLELSPARWVGYWGKGMVAGFQANELSEVELYMDLAYEMEPELATSTADYLRIAMTYPDYLDGDSIAEKFSTRQFRVDDGVEWALENQRAVRELFDR